MLQAVRHCRRWASAPGAARLVFVLQTATKVGLNMSISALMPLDVVQLRVTAPGRGHTQTQIHTHTHKHPDTKMTCWGVGNDLFCSCYSPHWPYLLFSTDCNFSADLWSAGQSLAQCENTENILNMENVQLRPIFLDCRTKQKYLFHTSGQSHKTRHHIIVCVSKTMFRDRWKIMGGDHQNIR